jgi:hypothetical protein
MMAGVEMIYGWASPAHFVWDASMAIFAYVGGLDHFGHPANHIGSIVLGIGGHMMNAIFVTIVFVALMRILKDPPGAVALALGIAYGLLLRRRLAVALPGRVREMRPQPVNRKAA